MVAQDDSMEMSLSSLFTADDNPIGKGTETDRMWNSMSVIESSFDDSKPGEFLPLRPGAQKKRASATTAIRHKQRGHSRPDDWVGKKSTRCSWKVKSTPSKGESEEKDNESQDTLSFLPSSSFSVDLEDEARSAPVYSKKHESQLGGDTDTKIVPAFVPRAKEKDVSGIGSSMHSVLTECSYDKELSMSLSSLDHGEDEFEMASDAPSTKDRLLMWQSMSAINTSSAFDSNDKDKPKLKPKAASSSAKDSKRDALPDLEMSLSSLDMQSLGSIKEDKTKKMWNSTSMIDSHPKDALGQGVRVTRILRDPSKHKFIAHNRPNDWLGSQGKPSRRSWSAKKIVEDDTTTPNTETESETEETSSVSKGIQIKRAAPHQMEKIVLRSTSNGSKVKQGDDIVRKS
jgi:hypothetical protein